MIDIRDYPEVVEKINLGLNSGSRVEVGNEKRRGENNIVVVRLTREMMTTPPKK